MFTKRNIFNFTVVEMMSLEIRLLFYSLHFKSHKKAHKGPGLFDQMKLSANQSTTIICGFPLWCFYSASVTGLFVSETMNYLIGYYSAVIQIHTSSQEIP